MRLIQPELGCAKPRASLDGVGPDAELLRRGGEGARDQRAMITMANTATGSAKPMLGKVCET